MSSAPGFIPEIPDAEHQLKLPRTRVNSVGCRNPNHVTPTATAATFRPTESSPEQLLIFFKSFLCIPWGEVSSWGGRCHTHPEDSLAAENSPAEVKRWEPTRWERGTDMERFSTESEFVRLWHCRIKKRNGPLPPLWTVEWWVSETMSICCFDDNKVGTSDQRETGFCRNAEHEIRLEFISKSPSAQTLDVCSLCLWKDAAGTSKRPSWLHVKVDIISRPQTFPVDRLQRGKKNTQKTSTG